jgi:hypothetical protein
LKLREVDNEAINCATVGIIAPALTGCASQSQFLSDKQGMAMQTALSRAKFDLN